MRARRRSRSVMARLVPAFVAARREELTNLAQELLHLMAVGMGAIAGVIVGGTAGLQSTTITT